MLIPVVSVLWKRKVVESVKSEVNRFEGIGELSEWQPWDTGREAIGEMKMGVTSTGGPAFIKHQLLYAGNILSLLQELLHPRKAGDLNEFESVVEPLGVPLLHH